MTERLRHTDMWGRARTVRLALSVLLAVLTTTAADAAPSSGSRPAAAHGVAPDGSVYHWRLYTRMFAGSGTLEDGRVVRFRFRLSCVGLVFPQKPEGSSGALCGMDYRPSRSKPAVHSFDARFLGASSDAVPRPDVVVSGTTDARVAAVRVVYTDAAGARHDVPVRFNRLVASGAGRHTRGARRSTVGVYTAFIPGEWAANDRLAERERERRPGDPSLPRTGALDLSELVRPAAGGCDPGPHATFAVIALDVAGERIDPPAAFCNRLAR